VSKLGATSGHSFQHMAATMTGMSQEEYLQMMIDGGRSPEGNRYVGGKQGEKNRG
jgi:protocatechuate 4,5-dioxygenase alpha chain